MHSPLVLPRWFAPPSLSRHMRFPYNVDQHQQFLVLYQTSHSPSRVVDPGDLKTKHHSARSLSRSTSLQAAKRKSSISWLRNGDNWSFSFWIHREDPTGPMVTLTGSEWWRHIMGKKVKASIQVQLLGRRRLSRRVPSLMGPPPLWDRPDLDWLKATV